MLYLITYQKKIKPLPLGTKIMQEITLALMLPDSQAAKC